MHLRRALLLFAIVLGLAALATSVSRPSRQSAPERRSTAPAEPQGQRPEASAPEPRGAGELRLPGPRGRRAATLKLGEAATLLVTVETAGQVELPGLGLASPATPVTPARFELFGTQPGSHGVRLVPAGGGEPRLLGRLVIEEG